MKLQINFGDIETSPSLADHVESTVGASVGRFGERITRVEVHLRDDKQGRRGADDHRCLMEARLAGDKPMAVEARADDIYEAVRDCADKLNRAIARRLERREA